MTSPLRGQTRARSSEPTARQRGDMMRMAQEWLIEEVTKTSIEPKEQTNPFGRAAQNLGHGLTMGLIPRKNTYEPEARITREEVAANPEWQERVDAMNTYQKLVLFAEEPGRMGTTREQFDSALSGILGPSGMEKLGANEELWNVGAPGGPEMIAENRPPMKVGDSLVSQAGDELYREPQTFQLNPGDVVASADGTIIARGNPEKPTMTTVNPGDSVLRNGKLIFTAPVAEGSVEPDYRTVAPEHTLVRDGEPIYTAPAAKKLYQGGPGTVFINADGARVATVEDRPYTKMAEAGRDLRNGDLTWDGYVQTQQLLKAGARVKMGPGEILVGPNNQPLVEIKGKPYSKIAELRADLDNKDINQEEYDFGRSILERGGQTIQVYPPGGPGTPGKSEREKATEAAHKASGEIAKTVGLLNQVKRAGIHSVGLRAKGSEIVSPILSQISPAFGEWSSEALTGVDQETIAKLRVQGQALMASSIEIVTGEESGRIAEPERRLTTNATAIRAPMSSYKEVVGALEAVLAVTYINMDRNRAVGGIVPKNDIGTREGMMAEMVDLSALGFTPQTTSDIVDVMILQREYLEQTGAPGLRPPPAPVRPPTAVSTPSPVPAPVPTPTAAPTPGPTLPPPGPVPSPRLLPSPTPSPMPTRNPFRARGL